MTDLGRVGLWTFHLDLQPAAAVRDTVVELEEMGWPMVWLPEAVGREPFVASTLVLAATDRLRVGTGVATIWSRDAMTSASGLRSLSEAYPGRFVLGLGVSHAVAVEGLRGQRYDKPLTRMRAYLDAMDNVFTIVPEPAEPPVRMLAALGPKMLALAAERAAGAHPYFVPVAHTAVAREAMGDGPLLAPEQAVVLERDGERARAIARAHMATYLGLPNYTNNLRRLGFRDDDLADGGSDRLVDAVVAWGDEDAVLQRVEAHHDAGADHVALQVLNEDPTELPLAEWRRLAETLNP